MSDRPDAPSRAEWAVLVGYGSIGRVHLRCLARRFDHTVVVDRSPSAREQAIADHPTVEVTGSLAEIEPPSPWSSCLAVIATWGPSHRAVFDELVALGARMVVCEKPLASSIADGQAMIDTARREQVDLAVNYTRRYMRQHDAVRDLAAAHALGEPVAVVVHGGARGLVTNGIHIVELACAMFGEAPVRTISTARGEPINPRSPDLRFFGGTAVWTFPSGRELSMTLSLSSSLKETIDVYFRDGIIELVDQRRAVVKARSAPSGDGPGATVHASAASEVPYDGPLPGVLTADDAIDALLAAVDAGDRDVIEPSSHLRSLDACVGALLAGERHSEVLLPIASGSADGERGWPIS